MIFGRASVPSVLQNKVTHTTTRNGIFKLIMFVAQRQNVSHGHFTICVYYIQITDNTTVAPTLGRCEFLKQVILTRPRQRDGIRAFGNKWV